ncbi:hypothetical protein HDE_03794 [Halotydeus destructor]|nr:hypothetical protein HDE_03794 [Halotydeus destructor]
MVNPTNNQPQADFANYVHKKHRPKKGYGGRPVAAQSSVRPSGSPTPPPSPNRRYTEKIVRRSGQDLSPLSPGAKSSGLPVSPMKGCDLFYQPRDSSSQNGGLYTHTHYMESLIMPQAQMVYTAYMASVAAQSALVQHGALSSPVTPPISPEPATLMTTSGDSSGQAYCSCSSCWYSSLYYNQYMSAYMGPPYANYYYGPNSLYVPQMSYMSNTTSSLPSTTDPTADRTAKTPNLTTNQSASLEPINEEPDNQCLIDVEQIIN